MKTTTESVKPDYALHPAYMLVEWIEENGMTQAELASRMDMSEKTLSRILTEKESISDETALKIESVTKMPASVFIAMQSRFNEYVARCEREETLKKHHQAVKAYPLAEMVRRKLIPAEKSQARAVDNVISFFGVASLDALNDVYGTRLAGAARKSATFDGNAQAVATWVREAELHALSVANPPAYSESLFKTKLAEIRSLTQLSPSEFGKRIIAACLEAGVFVSYVKPYEGVPFHGFCRWLNDRPLIVLSDRGKRADKFWFSFFHEAAHIILHNKKEMFFEHTKTGTQTKEEKEADKWARNILVPEAQWDAFMKRKAYEDADVVRFAKSTGIHSGIVAGRLQLELFAATHDNAVFKRYNRLFQSLEIAKK